jgi:hypothetical protein
VHLIDNTIHVIWLRYFIAEAPYTSYVNNSEILTMLLGATLAVYTYTRIRTHVYFNDDEAGLLVDIKSPIPLPIRSATRDLFAFCSPHQRFRTASDTGQAVMVVLCVLATCAVATWEVHAVLRLFWLCVLKLTLFALTVELELEGLKTPEEKMELRMALSGAGKYA